MGERLAELREAGLEENTIVLFWSDHGAGLPRMKRWIYDSGTRVPMIARIPKKFRVGNQGTPDSVDDQLISFIDLAPTMLNLAGIATPPHLQGRAFLGKRLSPPREYVFGARDRMDERYDLIRMVRDKRYRYVRNYESFKTYAQYLEYMDQMPTMQEMRRLKRGRKTRRAATSLLPQDQTGRGTVRPGERPARDSRSGRLARPPRDARPASSGPRTLEDRDERPWPDARGGNRRPPRAGRLPLRHLTATRRGSLARTAPRGSSPPARRAWGGCRP